MPNNTRARNSTVRYCTFSNRDSPHLRPTSYPSSRLSIEFLSNLETVMPWENLLNSDRHSVIARAMPCLFVTEDIPSAVTFVIGADVRTCLDFASLEPFANGLQVGQAWAIVTNGRMNDD